MSSRIEKPNKIIRLQAVNYIIDSDMLFEISTDGMILECLSRGAGLEAIAQVYEGLCRAHQSG